MMGAPEFWFSPPQGAIPVDLDTARHAAAPRDAAPDGTAVLVVLQEVLSAQLREGGAGFAAHLVAGAVDGEAEAGAVGSEAEAGAIDGEAEAGAIDGEAEAGAVDGLQRPSVALLCAIVAPLAVGGDAVFDAVTAAVAARSDTRVVEPVELPCGRGWLLVEDRSVPLFDDAATVVRQAQVLIPGPERDLLATLSLSTEYRSDWDGWMAVLGRVAATATFTPPGPATDRSAIAAALL